MEENFKFDVSKVILESAKVKRDLEDKCSGDILRTGVKLAGVLKNGSKIMFCGNGGSAADSQHIAAELVIRYRGGVERKALPAIALTVDPSMITAGGNDYGFDNVFAREIEAFGKIGDILVGISTSGNSENVLRAFKKAKEIGVYTIGLLGGRGGKIAQECDDKVIVPSEVTARIQESHILIGHIWCEIIEEYNFPELFEK